MKRYEGKNIEVDTNSDFQTTKMTINVSDGHMFDILMNNMYRDPIGSIIREITSNCFDSHHEAKVSDAVIVKLDEDDGGSYISFQDVGVGISPERMDKVYKELGRSTKQDDAEAIGFFGLGSKSPFAYIEEGFFVDTIYDGIAYSYFVHRGEKEPEITLITEDVTDQHNGSTVKIYFNRDSDKREFDDKLEAQLRYFDNVYVIGSNNFNNDYKLYEGKHFKFRDDCSTNILHLCIGKVTYPIDWEKLGVERINLPFALKFNIGDLPITPERESVKYTSVKKEDDVYVDTREIIKDKINLFKEELQELIGTEPVYHNNFFDYIEATTKKDSITLLNVTIPIPKGIVNSPKNLYQPLAEVGLEFSPDAFFSLFYVKRTNHVYQTKIRNIYLTDGYTTNLSRSDFANTLIVREFTAVGKFKQVKLDYLRSLAKKKNLSYIYFVTPNTEFPRSHRYLKFPKVTELDYSKWNKKKLYEYYKQVVLKELILNSIDYNTLEVPKEYEAQWKLNHATDKGKVEADEGEIVADDILIATKSDRRVVIDIESLTELHFVLYGFEKDLELLESYTLLFRNTKHNGYFRVLKIRQRDEKEIVLLKNVIKVTSFMSNNPLFREVATAAYIRNSKIDKYSFYPAETREDNINMFEAYSLLFYPLAEKWRSLIQSSASTINIKASNGSTQDLVNEILELAKANDWLDEDIVKGVQKVEEYFNGLELINYIVPSVKAIPHLVQFIKLSGKKVNREWEILEPWQKELLEELQEKFNYIVELSEDASSYGYGSKLERSVRGKRELYSKIVLNSRKNIQEISIFNSYHNEKSKLVESN